MSQKPPDLASGKNPLASLGQEQQKLIVELQQMLEIPTEEVADMFEAVQRGESMGEYFGYTPEVCNAIEHAALAYYRTGRYEQAINIFAWLADVTNGAHASAWRGIGACHQATKAFGAAIPAYQRALVANPDDRLSQVFCGECLCHIDKREEGLNLLQSALRDAPPAEQTEPHLVRARAIIAAQAARPSVGPKASAAKADASDTKKKSSDDAVDKPAGIDEAMRKEVIAHTYDEAMQGVMADPELKAQLERLTLAVRNRELTLKEVADFSDEQMDAGYAVACQFLERGDPIKALETAGWLLWIDSRDGRFYQLAGICMHHLKLWCIADYLYHLALRYGGQEPTTLVYQAEVKIMLDEKVEAKTILLQGLKLAEGQAPLQDVYSRGQFLLKQLAA
jgi:tetratricopeptide (TPR) repeat protein